MNQQIKKIMAFLLFTFSVTVTTDAADWPRWRGPNGDGISTETDWNPQALAKRPKILWKASLGTSGANVAIQGKYLYTTGGDFQNDTILCLNAENGKTIWKYSYECKNKSYGAPATPTIDGDLVYTLSAEGHVFCFNAPNGKVQWFTHIVKEYKAVCPPYGCCSSPVVEGDLLIIYSNSFGIALNKHTGKLVWQSPPPDRQGDMPSYEGEYATPVLYNQNGKRYMLTFSINGLNSVEVETGRLNWFYEWNPTVAKVADPIVFPDKVFITYYTTRCVLLDIENGTPKVLYQNQNMQSDVVTPVLINGYLYGCHGMAFNGLGVLRCLEFKSGTVMWEKDLGRPMFISAAGARLLLLTDRGTLIIAEASHETY
jgi:outer membrane protein assembly factor BamB